MPEGTTAATGFPLSSSPSNDASSNPTLNSDDIDGNRTNNNGNANDDNAQQKLVLWQGIALLTADCMGVGILGLPSDMKLLGWAIGLTFLVLNCPINYYAGNLLSMLASDIEMVDDNTTLNDDDEHMTEIELASAKQKTSIRRKFSNRRKAYRGLPQNQQDETMNQTSDGPDYDDEEEYDVVTSSDCDENDFENVGAENDFSEGAFQDEVVGEEDGFEDGAVAVFRGSTDSNNNHDRKTSDLINITASIFTPVDSLTSRTCVLLVKIIYYVNLFLVLGDYILVMSRSVAAFFGEENICLPTAGAVASILMFGLCQFRTMANLGRSVSLASLFALLIVLVQCLFHHRNNMGDASDVPETRNIQEEDDDDGVWGKFSSLAGIGFAVGSQKLFLNIRHELQHRDEASRVLAGSLFTYGMAYVAVVLLAGPDPPSFLFDAIPEGWGRKMAGLLLWFHVAVSYAINSQALCASLDHMLPVASRGATTSLHNRSPATRWFAITFVVSLSSYIVSNAIPFFKDLVALIGALTSVPLSLTLPAILYRKARNIALLLPDRYCLSTDSYLLLLYSFVFLIIGLAGALSEIEEDWLSQGKPFACR